MIECGFHREHDDNDEHFGLTGLITTCLKFILDEAEDMATQGVRREATQLWKIRMACYELAVSHEHSMNITKMSVHSTRRDCRRLCMRVISPNGHKSEIYRIPRFRNAAFPQPRESLELQHWIRPCRTSREWQMRPVRTQVHVSEYRSPVTAPRRLSVACPYSSSPGPILVPELDEQC